jgi:hypothetical protein
VDCQTDTPGSRPTQEPQITLCEDGYVRLTHDTLLAIPLQHLLSGLDEDAPAGACEGASLAPISGYTEWVSTTTPAITLGWDWQLDLAQGRPRYARLGAPRTNVMLVDTHETDLGRAKTAMFLELAIDALPWQEEVSRSIAARYA